MISMNMKRSLGHGESNTHMMLLSRTRFRERLSTLWERSHHSPEKVRLYLAMPQRL